MSVDSRWPIDQQLLKTVAELEREPFRGPNADDVIRASGLPRSEALKGLAALYRAGYIEGSEASTQQGFDLLDVSLTERGRREVGQWPSSHLAEQLMDLLAVRIEEETDPAQQSRLRALLTASKNVGTAALGEIVAAIVRQSTGLR